VWVPDPSSCVDNAQVRLEHMLARLRVLQGAATAAAPSRLADSLFLSGAVEAASLHVLRHLGVTHILNATEVRPSKPQAEGTSLEPTHFQRTRALLRGVMRMHEAQVCNVHDHVRKKFCCEVVGQPRFR
jgi:hypothetical protein